MAGILNWTADRPDAALLEKGRWIETAELAAEIGGMQVEEEGEEEVPVQNHVLHEGIKVHSGGLVEAVVRVQAL